MVHGPFFLCSLMGSYLAFPLQGLRKVCSKDHAMSHQYDINKQTIILIFLIQYLLNTTNIKININNNIDIDKNHKS